MNRRNFLGACAVSTVAPVTLITGTTPEQSGCNQQAVDAMAEDIIACIKEWAAIPGYFAPNAVAIPFGSKPINFAVEPSKRQPDRTPKIEPIIDALHNGNVGLAQQVCQSIWDKARPRRVENGQVIRTIGGLDSLEVTDIPRSYEFKNSIGITNICRSLRIVTPRYTIPDLETVDCVMLAAVLYGIVDLFTEMESQIYFSQNIRPTDCTGYMHKHLRPVANIKIDLWAAEICHYTLASGIFYVP